MNYTYSILSDTLNGAADTYALEKEVSVSSITIALNSISIVGDVLTFDFKAALSASEETALGVLVSNHEGQKINEPNVVELSNQTPLGIPKVAFTKPDGSSKTYTSHNFCDSSTWPSVNDSAWQLDSVVENLGKLKVYRAEVQFTHDVQMATLSPTPAELQLDIMAGGAPVPSESKIFKTLYDVFDLGNKHYSMNATVDGVPGLTTVQFDYTDAIVLDPALLMAMRFQLKNHLALGGTHCSVALIAGPVE